MTGTPATVENRPESPGRWIGPAVWTILALSLGLRLYLAAQGGALFWTDEKRYLASREAVAAISAGDATGAARFLFSTADHPGFRWLALVPATIERAVFGEIAPHAKICAAFFALFSTANLFLIWRIARRQSDDPREALLALAFAASSNTLFFFSRHCLPYDAALTFFLVALWVSLGPGAFRRSGAVGLLCAAGCLTYTGYWSVGGVILIFDVLWRKDGWAARVRRALWGLVGLLVPLLGVVAVGWLCGYDLVANARDFSRTVIQGDFGRGWRLALDYLPAADGLLPVTLAAAVIGGIAVVAWRDKAEAWLRWAAMGVVLLGLWLLLCDGVHQFVLYGRTVRAVVPFLALSAAGAVGWFRRSASPRGRMLIDLACIAICGCGLWAMRTPLTQVFPVDFRAQAEVVKAAVRQQEPDAVFDLQFADYLYSPDFPGEPPPHRVLLRREHPQHYLPYLYEGYTERQRPLYLGHDTAMRLIQLDTSRGLHVFHKSPGAEWLAPYPGPLALRLRVAAQEVGVVEAVVSHGEDGDSAPRLLIEHLAAQRLRLGLQQGKSAPVWSEAVECDYAAEHRLLVSLPSFYPPTEDSRFAGAREFAALGGRALVRWDDHTLFNQAMTGSAQPLAQLRVGAGVPARENVRIFGGKILSARQLDPRTSADAEWLPASAEARCFPDYLGPLELMVRFPPGAQGRSQPLVSSGKAGAGDLLYVTYVDDEHVVFGLDHWGGPTLRSTPVAVRSGIEQRLIVAMGSLFPPETRSEYAQIPGLRDWRRRLLLRLGGETVLSAEMDFHAAAASEVTLGSCTTGATTAEPGFTGELRSQRSLGWQALGLGGAGIPPTKGPFFGDYHGTTELELKFPASAGQGAEPLLVTGQPGAGDQLFVRYVEGGRIELGFDHWGSPALRSLPLAVDFAAKHRLAVSLGSLFPPEADPCFGASPHLRVLKKWLFVRLDEQVVFSHPMEFFPAPPDGVRFGRGLPGSMAAGPMFTGDITAIHHLPAEALGLGERSLRGPEIKGPFLAGGFTGPLALEIQLPQTWVPIIEPLVVAGDFPNGDMVFIKYHGSPRIQLGYRHRDQPAIMSPPLPMAPGAKYRIGLSMGALFPPEQGDRLERRLRPQPLRIAVDGRIVLEAAAEASAPDAQSLFLGVSPLETKGVRPAFFGKILRVETTARP